jgi:hypothetical protein
MTLGVPEMDPLDVSNTRPVESGGVIAQDVAWPPVLVGKIGVIFVALVNVWSGGT